jgi:hypothetical protein
VTGVEIVILLAACLLVIAGIAGLEIGRGMADSERESEDQTRAAIGASLTPVSAKIDAVLADHLEPEEVSRRAAFIVEFARSLGAIAPSLRPRGKSAMAFLSAALAFVMATVLGIAVLQTSVERAAKNPPATASEPASTEAPTDGEPSEPAESTHPPTPTETATADE